MQCKCRGDSYEKCMQLTFLKLFMEAIMILFAYAIKTMNFG